MFIWSMQLTKVNVCHQFINHFCLCCFRYWISAYTTPTRKCPWNLTRLTQRAENERGKAGALFRLLQKTMCLIKGALVLSHSILFLLKHFMKYFFVSFFQRLLRWKICFHNLLNLLSDQLKLPSPLPLSLALGISSLSTCSTDLSAVW